MINEKQKMSAKIRISRSLQKNGLEIFRRKSWVVIHSFIFLGKEKNDNYLTF